MHHVYAFKLCKYVYLTYTRWKGLVHYCVCMYVCVYLSVCYFRSHRMYLGEIKNELKKPNCSDDVGRQC